MSGPHDRKNLHGLVVPSLPGQSAATFRPVTYVLILPNALPARHTPHDPLNPVWQLPQSRGKEGKGKSTPIQNPTQLIHLQGPKDLPNQSIPVLASLCVSTHTPRIV
jgi:hypothetical protein